MKITKKQIKYAGKAQKCARGTIKILFRQEGWWYIVKLLSIKLLFSAGNRFRSY